MTLSRIFVVFLRAGLTFGGGLSILASLQAELVERRRALSREEFLTVYSLGRIVPSGTMTAIAVAFGHRLGGWPGTFVALAGLTLPSFTSTLALAIAYTSLRDSRAISLLPLTILPAALALVVTAAVSLSRTIAGSRPDMILAGAALIGSAALHVNPAILLLLGGGIGALLMRPSE